jgi:U3 small nucleolar RNA-associated protein 10
LQIQQYNVEAVLLASLPYHETQLFVRLVQLLDLSRTPRWRFLVGRVQQAGASLPRDALVQLCSRDLGVLEAICEAAQQVSDARQASKPLLSFAAVVVMEVLAGVTTVSDELVKRILPYILDGFKKGAAVEYQVSGHAADCSPLVLCAV